MTLFPLLMQTEFERDWRKMVSEIRGERSGTHRHTHTNNSRNWGMRQEFQLLLIFNNIYILFKAPKRME